MALSSLLSLYVSIYTEDYFSINFILLMSNLSHCLAIYSSIIGAYPECICFVTPCFMQHAQNGY